MRGALLEVAVQSHVVLDSQVTWSSASASASASVRVGHTSVKSLLRGPKVFGETLCGTVKWVSCSHVAVPGALLGIAVGTSFGVALQSALRSQGITDLAIPDGRHGLFILAAAAAGSWLRCCLPEALDTSRFSKPSQRPDALLRTGFGRFAQRRERSAPCWARLAVAGGQHQSGVPPRFEAIRRWRDGSHVRADVGRAAKPRASSSSPSRRRRARRVPRWPTEPSASTPVTPAPA